MDPEVMELRDKVLDEDILRITQKGLRRIQIHGNVHIAVTKIELYKNPLKPNETPNTKSRSHHEDQ